jgi:hypothetical protein
MTEELEALFFLAERHLHSVETLRDILCALHSGEDYMTLQQRCTYASLRRIIEDHDRVLRERAMSFTRPSPL